MLLPVLLHGQDYHLDKMPIGPSTMKGAVNSTFPNPGMGNTIYRDYIPYNLDKKAEVNVNLVFIQKTTGQGIFKKTIPNTNCSGKQSPKP